MKKGLKVTIISIMMLLFIGAGIVVLYLTLPLEEKEADGQSIADMNEFSYATPEVTTDLKDGRFVRIEFLMITDGKKALKELGQREFQVKNILIKEISFMSEDDFSTGLGDLEVTLMNRLNEVMVDGKITDVYTTSKILQ